MVRPSVASDESYTMYELYALLKHAVTAGEAAANTITLTGLEAHAVVIADEEYARAYADGVLTTITGVTFPVADTIVAFTSLTEGETVDLYLPLTTGSLVSNAASGKLDLPRIQTVQGYQAATNQVMVDECGTERRLRVDLRCTGIVVLGLYRYGNEAMADFAAAHEGDSDKVKIPLLIDIVDTTVATATHDLLFQATVKSFDRVSQEADNEQGIITDTVTLSWVPDVVTL